MTQTFRSEIAWWLIGLVAAAFGGCLLSAYTGFTRGEWLISILSLVAALFICWVVFGTYYRIGENLLLIRSGPFRWRIAIQDIHHITPTHSPLSSPALSLNRLRIDYSDGRSLMVSPADKPGFLAAIEKERGQ